MEVANGHNHGPLAPIHVSARQVFSTMCRDNAQLQRVKRASSVVVWQSTRVKAQS